MGSKKTVAFGTCAIGGYSPKKEEWKLKKKTLNIKIKFEEALKLNLALDECVRELNKYKRSTSEGKRAAVNLVLHLEIDRIAIIEDQI